VLLLLLLLLQLLLILLLQLQLLKLLFLLQFAIEHFLLFHLQELLFCRLRPHALRARRAVDVVEGGVTQHIVLVMQRLSLELRLLLLRLLLLLLLRLDRIRLAVSLNLLLLLALLQALVLLLVLLLLLLLLLALLLPQLLLLVVLVPLLLLLVKLALELPQLLRWDFEGRAVVENLGALREKLRRPRRHRRAPNGNLVALQKGPADAVGKCREHLALVQKIAAQARDFLAQRGSLADAGRQRRRQLLLLLLLLLLLCPWWEAVLLLPLLFGWRLRLRLCLRSRRRVQAPRALRTLRLVQVQLLRHVRHRHRLLLLENRRRADRLGRGLHLAVSEHRLLATARRPGAVRQDRGQPQGLGAARFGCGIAGGANANAAAGNAAAAD
jgi:hypothetical protein